MKTHIKQRIFAMSLIVQFIAISIEIYSYQTTVNDILFKYHHLTQISSLYQQIMVP